MLDAPRYARLLERAVRLFDRAPRRRPGHGGNLPVVELAAQALERRAGKLGKAVKACRREPGGGALHRLRIRGKQLRYACEFFGPLYGGEFDEQVQRLVAVQDALGRFQDRVVLGRLAEELRDEALARPGPGSPEYLYVLGLLTAAGRDGAHVVEGELERAHRALGGRRSVRALARQARRRADEVRAAMAVNGVAEP